jgi:hypothetical protein
MNTRTLLIALCWALATSSIVLQALYTYPSLQWFHYVLLLLISVLSGAVIVDLRDIILSYIIVLPLSLALMIFIMGILPALAGKLASGSMAMELVAAMVINMIMRSTFPGVWVLCLIAGIIGGGIGEKIEAIPEISDVV